MPGIGRSIATRATPGPSRVRVISSLGPIESLRPRILRGDPSVFQSRFRPPRSHGIPVGRSPSDATRRDRADGRQSLDNGAEITVRSHYGPYTDPPNGQRPAGHDPGRHARPPGHGPAGRPHRTDLRDRGPGRPDRHLGPRHGGLVHRADDRQHRQHVARARCRDGRRRASVRPSPSPWSSWGFRCPASGRHSTSRRA